MFLFRRSVFALSVSVLGFLLAVVVFSSVVVAEDPANPKKTKLELRIDRSLEKYKVFVGDSSEPMESIHALTWNNPLAGGNGKFRTVLFIHQGQPKSVCCIWPGPSGLYHEFGSLTRESLKGTLGGNVTWQMPADALEFRPIPDAGTPAEDRRRRMSQMKRLIDRFSAIETVSRKGEPTREVLRQLTTPLYRYQQKRGDIVDGAVFCFVHTTDPEALVVIEAVKKNGVMSWEYAFVRRTTLSVIGELDEKQVWSTDRVGYQTFNQIRYPE